jgi:hypothetical protein
MHFASRIFALTLSLCCLFPVVESRAETIVGFGTDNLLLNADFATGLTEWSAKGPGVTCRPQKGGAVLAIDSQYKTLPGEQNFRQNITKPIGAGRTLCLRFKASGTTRFSVVFMENPENRVAFRRVLGKPGADESLITLAFRTQRSYNINQLSLQFNLGYGGGELSIKEPQVLDMGDTPLDALPLTSDTENPNNLPALTASTTPTPAAPIEIKTVAVITAPVKPLLPAGTSMLKNGDFAQGDAGWKAWGEDRVGAKLENGKLQLRLAPRANEPSSCAGFKQLIDTVIPQGQHFTISFKARGTARFETVFEESAAGGQSLLRKIETPLGEEREWKYNVTANRDFKAGETQLSILVALDAGEIEFSDFKVVATQ